LPGGISVKEKSIKMGKVFRRLFCRIEAFILILIEGRNNHEN
jgi:hypothetical protein